jgi:hypothetical protein
MGKGGITPFLLINKQSEYFAHSHLLGLLVDGWMGMKIHLYIPTALFVFILT